MSRVKIIATKTDEGWGYREGDVLEIRQWSGDYAVARNLTRPHMFGREYAFIRRSEFDFVEETVGTTVKPVIIYEYRFLYIPVWRKTVREDYE
jgi:hypothetical protein